MKEKSDVAVKWVRVDKIKPNRRNPNHHTPEQIERLGKLIEYYGWRAPLIVSNQSGLLVAGHGRIEAAKKIGKKYAPIIYQDFSSDDEEYGVMVSDNAISSWSEMDIGAINLELPNFNPEFDINMLGIRHFELEPADKARPNSDTSVSGQKETVGTKDFLECPYCEEKFEKSTAKVIKWSAKT